MWTLIAFLAVGILLIFGTLAAALQMTGLNDSPDDDDLVEQQLWLEYVRS